MSHEQKIATHIRLTPDNLRDLWLEKLSPTEQYLLNLLNAFEKPGFEITIENIPDFCDRWKLSVSAFYKAKASLTLKGKISEVITGAVELTVLKSGRESNSTIGELDSPID